MKQVSDVHFKMQTEQNFEAHRDALAEGNL